jgi:hypothetical protein
MDTLEEDNWTTARWDRKEYWSKGRQRVGKHTKVTERYMNCNEKV